MTTVTISMPVDVVDDLSRMAPTLGLSDHQALIRFYVGQGLRADISRRIRGGR